MNADNVKKNNTPATDSQSAKESLVDKDLVRKAVDEGKAIIKNGGSKAESARAIFSLIHEQPRDAVIAAFIEGATITPKGAPTYFYNISRKFKREKKQESKSAAT